MIVDLHAHYHPRSYVDALQPLYDRDVTSARHPETDDEAHIRARLQMMDKADVSIQVLSPNVDRVPYSVDEAAAVTAARLGNDLYAALVARYPTRFRAFVSLPLPHIEASLSEMNRGLDELGMVGVNMQVSVCGRSIAEEQFLPLYEELNRREAVLFLHPSGNGVSAPPIIEFGLSGALGTYVEDAVIVSQLIAKKIPAMFPQIKFVVPNLGGSIAMLLETLDNRMPKNLPERPSDTARRFYYDTVCHGSHAAFLCAWRSFGADHLLAASGYPVLLGVEPYERTFSWIKGVEIPASDKEQILERTATSVLGFNSS